MLMNTSAQLHSLTVAEATASPSLFVALKALSNLSDDIKAMLHPAPESVPNYPATPTTAAAAHTDTFDPPAVGDHNPAAAAGIAHQRMSSNSISGMTSGTSAGPPLCLQPRQAFLPQVWLINDLGGDVDVCMSGDNSNGGSLDDERNLPSHPTRSRQEKQWKKQVAIAGCSMPLLLIDPWVCQMYGRHVALPPKVTGVAQAAGGIPSGPRAARLSIPGRRGRTALGILGDEQEKQLYFQLPALVSTSDCSKSSRTAEWLGPVFLDRFACGQSYSQMLHMHTSDGPWQHLHRSSATALDAASFLRRPLPPSPVFGVIGQLQPQEERGARVLRLHGNVQVTNSTSYTLCFHSSKPVSFSSAVTSAPARASTSSNAIAATASGNLPSTPTTCSVAPGTSMWLPLSLLPHDDDELLHVSTVVSTLPPAHCMSPASAGVLNVQDMVRKTAAALTRADHASSVSTAQELAINPGKSLQQPISESTSSHPHGLLSEPVNWIHMLAVVSPWVDPSCGQQPRCRSWDLSIRPAAMLRNQLPTSVRATLNLTGSAHYGQSSAGMRSSIGALGRSSSMYGQMTHPEQRLSWDIGPLGELPIYACR